MEFQSNPLLVIKPKGITSFTAVNQLKAVLPKKTKIGHCGTLDPMAEGLLIVLVGRSQTKLQSTFLNLNKVYIAEITFGVTSNTYDIDTNSILKFSEKFNKIKDLDLDIINSTLSENFQGEITQTVPAYSAVKVKGKRLYESARQHIKLDLPARKVTIYSFNILNFINKYKEGSKDLSVLPKLQVEFKVSKGTYIRSIAHDLGNLLGVGAVLSGLNRVSIGDYSIEHAITLEKAQLMLKDNFI